MEKGGEVAIKITLFSSDNPCIIEPYSYNLPGHFLVLEQGAKNLKHFTEEGKYCLEDTIRIMRDIARAIACVNKAGYVYMDVKPQNFLFANDTKFIEDDEETHINGTIKLTDFGNAVPIKTDLRNGAGGTPTYMSPEVLKASYETRGTNGKLNLRSDVFSLGVLFYEIITGKYPRKVDYDDPDGDLVKDLLYCPHIWDLNDYCLDGHKHAKKITRIINKCLKEEPSKRYSSAVEVADRLEECVDANHNHCR